MPLEPIFNFIDDLDSANPNNSPDQVKEAANHLRGTKNAVKGSFPNLGQQSVTKTAAEINDLVQPDTTDTLTNKTIDSALYIGTQSGFVGDVTGDLTGNSSGTHTGNVVGNASTASAFNSSRTITISGDATGSNASSTGSHNIAINIGADKINFNNEMNNVSTSGTYVVNGSRVLLPGVFNIGPFSNDGYGAIFKLEIQVNGGWQAAANTRNELNNPTYVQIVSNGTNVRVTSTTNYAFSYTKIFN